MPPATPPTPSPFALFLSSVEGHVVSRYGATGPTRAPEAIGARRTATGSGWVWSWDTGAIAALTHAEVAAYGREYAAAVRSGALRERTAEEFEAYTAAQRAQADKAAKDAAAPKVAADKKPAASAAKE
jgi:hypothetical protein